MSIMNRKRMLTRLTSASAAPINEMGLRNSSRIFDMPAVRTDPLPSRSSDMLLSRGSIRYPIAQTNESDSRFVFETEILATLLQCKPNVLQPHSTQANLSGQSVVLCSDLFLNFRRRFG